MTWVDLVVLGVLAVSALLAFMRGLVREVLGIGAWVGAIFAAVWALPLVRPQFQQWIGDSPWVDPVAFARGVPRHADRADADRRRWISRLVRASALGGLDRTLGLVFGLARGAALVIIAYIVAGMVVPVDRWPEPVLQARSLPPVYRGAQLGRWNSCRPNYRPQALRAAGRAATTTAEALLQRDARKAAQSASRPQRGSGEFGMAFDRAARRRQVPRGVRRIRRLERARRRRGHRARPARAAAPRPGSHRHRQLRRQALPLASRPGPGRRQFQRRPRDRLAARPHRHRPQPLRHHRRHHPAQRPAAVRRFRVRRLRGGAQRQPDQRPRAAPHAGAPRLPVPVHHRFRGVRPPDRHQPVFHRGRPADRRAEAGGRRLFAGRAVQRGADGRARSARRAPADPRPHRQRGHRRLGAGVARPARSTSSAPTSCATSSRARSS